jgi:hypothetical protein
VTARWACAALVAAAVAGGCGGERQDADEPSGEFTLQVLDASFPEQQSIAQQSRMLIEVRNTDDRELPNLAVTVETEPESGEAAAIAFARAEDDPRLADAGRPVWIVDTGPEGGTSAYTNTWAVGPLLPGQTKTVEWRVTAVQPGDYTVNYRVSPGLDGKAVPANGQLTTGSFDVSISDEPVPARVNEEGEVVRGEQAGGAVGD